VAVSPTRRLAREAEYSPESFVDMNNSWIITSLPLFILIHFMYLRLARLEVFAVLSAKITDPTGGSVSSNIPGAASVSHCLESLYNTTRVGL
jgi:hypothetical protein